ncbi:MAG: hypothetical protein RJA57_1588 [Bacteroidota bacterium]
MNANRRVLQFVAGSFSLYLLVSFAALFLPISWTPLNRVNLISDLFPGNVLTSLPSDRSDKTDSPVVVIEKRPDRKFDLYKQGRSITRFHADTSAVSLEGFARKLAELKAGKRRKVRIAYFGDSMIEGDLLTQTLRQLLQQQFGGSGVGFVPITSQVSQFRQTVSHSYSGGWRDENFKSGRSGRLYLSGHVFRSNGDWVQMTDRTVTDSLAVIEKSLLCGPVSGATAITVNGRSVPLDAGAVVNRIPLANDRSRSIRVGVSDDRLPVYGISFESASGIILDNFSFRGITGIEFATIDSAFLARIAAANPYDLIVFQYGVNLLFRPNERNFNWYGRTLIPVVRKLQHCFPESDLLLVSTADRAFRYGGEYRSAVGIDSLVRTQAAIAYETGSSFYNQYASMGGPNSIVEWAQQKPSLANRDYVHPNHRGAEVLAGWLYEAILKDYNKSLRTR